jgi:hypothetical protein
VCTYATVKTEVSGSAKGPGSPWFRVSDATVYFDHPVHALGAEHTLNIDFLDPSKGPSARVAVELTAASAVELMTAIQAALDSAPPEELGERGTSEARLRPAGTEMKA